MNEPLVVPEDVMLTDDAMKVGVTESDVPTNASAVTVRVCAELPTADWKPRFEKVATPP